MISNLAKRLIVAAIGIPALVFIVYKGNWWLYMFCILVSVLGSWELAAMLLGKQIEIGKQLATILAILLVSMFQFSQQILMKYPSFSSGEAGLLFIFVMFVLVAYLIMAKVGVVNYTIRLSLAILTAIYPAFFISFSILIHRDFGPDGWVILLFVFVNTWIADTFAYAFGRWFGKRKLALEVSPKKTWVGFVFSFFGGLFTAFLFYAAVPDLKFERLIAFSLAATLFGQIGDLIESAIKRDCGVKDSSNLIPGHGGVLDRFDSLMMALPAVYFMMRIWG